MKSRKTRAKPSGGDKASLARMSDGISSFTSLKEEMDVFFVFGIVASSWMKALPDVNEALSSFESFVFIEGVGDGA